MSDKDLSNTSGTNWTALESMNDEGIDYSDIPPLTEEFFQKASTLKKLTLAKGFNLNPSVL
jgi:hypothetical protein